MAPRLQALDSSARSRIGMSRQQESRLAFPSST
ncbi:hypothetical protein EPYR_01192 [Erwinia pyrifoliae DSM 12163]|nr:hypothetical protein EPYR_01192 [Erwinia pyrifoliae DSM 12163]